jgi:hypothetical protein
VCEWSRDRFSMDSRLYVDIWIGTFCGGEEGVGRIIRGGSNGELGGMMIGGVNVWDWRL